MIEFTGPNGFRHIVQNQGMYSDGTPMVKMDIELVAKNADSVTVQAHDLLEFVTAMFLVDSVDSLGQINNLVLPYLPGARQDRINPTGDVLFTARSVAEMINVRAFNQVVYIDPHSFVMPSHLRDGVEYPLEMVAQRVWGGYTGVIAPDKGAEDRAKRFSDTMGLPLYYGEKVRDVSTGRLSGFEIDVPAGGHYLVVDDICDGGGTFVGLGEKIAECGAYADLYVTHGIFSKGLTGLKKFYKNIYTTDTLPQTIGTYRIPVVEDMEKYQP